jgi:O-antigen/teichoic acid export membrane protein
LKFSFPAHLVRRLMLMIGGEAMQSGFHFALNLALLHLLSAQGYGLFALAMVMGGVGLSYIRSLTAVPATIWMSKSTNSAGVDAHDVTFGSAALVVALLMGLGTGLLMRLLGDPSGIGAACFVSAWSLRSHMRTAFFARRMQLVVSISDGVFTFVGIVLAAAAIWFFADALQATFYALAAANLIGIFVLVRLARRKLRISFRGPTWRRYARLWPQLCWSGFSATTTNIQGQCLALLVAGIAGPAAYAPLAAVLVLFAPLRIVSLAFSNMTQPELAKLMHRNETARVWTQARIWALVMGLGSLAYGCGILFILPMIKSQALQGVPTGVIGLLAIANYLPIMLYVMPRIVLEIMSDFRIVALITMGGAIVGLALIAVILAVAPPTWALAGSAVSETFVLALSWYFARHRMWNIEHPNDKRDSWFGSWRRAAALAVQRR